MISLLLVATLQQFIPAAPLVHDGLADAREPRTLVGALVTNIFSHPFRSRPTEHVANAVDGKTEQQAVVGLASNFPLTKVRGATLSLQGGATTRFRLQAPDADILAIDYMVALPLSYVRGKYAARLRVLHRSAHLGDEFLAHTGLSRQQYTHEEADAVLARSFGTWRVYAGEAITLRSWFPRDGHQEKLGMDGWQKLDDRFDVVAGMDWQKHSMTYGLGVVQLAAGLQAHGQSGQILLLARYSNGASPMGEFFQDREQYFSIAFQLSRSESTGNPPPAAGIW